MSRALAVAQRRPLDAYYTDDALARALVALLPIEPTETVLEPHAGGGAFVRALRMRALKVTGLDVDPAAIGVSQAHRGVVGDFLAWSEPADWIVGNPPFRDFARHLDHALTLAPRVAFLLRLGSMESRTRAASWKRWPLRRVYVLAERPSFTSNGKTDSAAYGWFLFLRHFDGPAEVVPGWSP